MLLRNFASNHGCKRGKEKIWVFDKRTDKRANPNIKNIAAQYGFYDVKLESELFSIEDGLSKLENKVAPILTKLVVSKTCAGLSKEDRAWLAIFCAVQFVRVENFRQQTKEIHQALINKILRLGGNERDVAQNGLGVDDESVKKFTVGFLIESLREFPLHFASKLWFLLEAPDGGHLYIGDNPVSLHNDHGFGPYGNIGLAVPGIQIYLPIAPTLVLTMWDASVLRDLEKQLEDVNQNHNQLVAAKLSGHAHVDPQPAIELAQRLRAQLENRISQIKAGGCEKIMSDELVTFVNSLQVMYASRFVMSKTNNFGLVERMIQDSDKYRHGIKPTLN